MEHGKIYLSPPDVGEEERILLLDALDSGWVAPLGAHVDAFEAEVATAVGVGHGAALCSGTAALHLALLLLGVGPGDEVVVPTFTFVATANAVSYTGATPRFVDAEATSWNLCPDLLAEELDEAARAGRLPRAVISVDLYGQCADHDRIAEVCATYEVPVVEDAAEAIGATYRDRAAGSFGTFGVVSFNGNKIITTSGGGMLLGDDAEQIEHARRLASQARDPVPYYEHSELGFNYRLSNLLAAIGRGQLRALPKKIDRRREIFGRYVEEFGAQPGIDPQPIAPWGEPNHWLTVVTIDPDAFGADRDAIYQHLLANGIEARPTWKPMHLQPLYRGVPVRGGATAELLWERGLCLPSGTRYHDHDIDRVIETVLSVAR